MMAERNSISARLGVLFVGSRNTDGTSDTFGRRRLLAGLGAWEWSFLIVSIINIAICISLSIYRLVYVIKKDSSNPDLVFTILLIINSAFCLFYVIHGLLKELQFEIYMFIFAAVFILCYCIIEYSVDHSRRNSIKLVRLILCCIFGPVNIFLAIKVAREFGWLEFRILGASEHMQSMYHQATLFASLLKFDLQAAVSYVILVCVTSQWSHSLEAIIVPSVGLPICLIWTLLGWLSMRREWKCGTIIFAIFGLLMPAYVIYSIVIIFLRTPILHTPIVITSEYVVGGLALLVRGILFIELYIVYRNFGKGLRERAFDNEANERTGLLAR